MMNPKYDTKHRYEFQIDGRINLLPESESRDDFLYERKNDDYRSAKAVHDLNARKEEIADQISSVLERQLPSSFKGNVKIVTSLEFGKGSIALVGDIAVLDWMGIIADAATLIQLMYSLIQFAVKKVIAREAAQTGIAIDYASISINVTPNFVPASQDDIIFRQLQMRQEEQTRMILAVYQDMENLLSYIRDLREKNSAFRLSSYSNRLQLPARFFSDIGIQLSLLLIILLQAMNFLGVSTIRDWFLRFFGTGP